jgi:alkanesulfonate monooxygenase SsuD/methylene tetrahydromethanopterin reductase-like flavin-dependent oxidoreductase (luciferase family)
MQLRVGITVPQFREEPDAAFESATRAEAEGLDGVFVFDHLWPLRQPDRPALHSYELLAALAVETPRVAIGTLVARVALLPDAVVVHAFKSLHRLLGDRLIAALGTGDSSNKDENIAYGVEFPPKAARLASLANCCGALHDAGVTTWAGGLSPEVRAIAAAHAGGWNAWGIDPTALAAGIVEAQGLAGPRPLTMSWGGQVLIGRDEAAADEKAERFGSRPGVVHGTIDTLRDHFRAVDDAGAQWAICAPLDIGTDPDALTYVAEARQGLN